MPKPEEHPEEQNKNEGDQNQDQNNGEQKPEEHQQGDGWMLLQDKPSEEHKEVEPPHIAPIDPKLDMKIATS